MKWKTWMAVTACVAAQAVSVPAAAQVAVIGADPTGAVPNMATTFAKIVSSAGPLQLRVQTMASENQYIPLVNRGQMDFGVVNVFGAIYAHTGHSIYEGRANPDLRTAFTIMPFSFGVIVREDSEMRTAADLKGRRWPAGFDAQKKGQLFQQGIAANLGIVESDMRPVRVAGFPQMWDAFKRGNVDVAFVAIGSSTVQEIAASVGGVRYIELNDSRDAVQAMQPYLPRGWVEQITPPPTAGSKPQPHKGLRYDFLVMTSKHASEEVVYQTVKAVYESEQELKAIGPFWRSFRPAYMANAQGIEYHPGAVRLFKEKGVWKE